MLVSCFQAILYYYVAEILYSVEFLASSFHHLRFSSKLFQIITFCFIISPACLGSLAKSCLSNLVIKNYMSALITSSKVLNIYSLQEYIWKKDLRTQLFFQNFCEEQAGIKHQKIHYLCWISRRTLDHWFLASSSSTLMAVGLLSSSSTLILSLPLLLLLVSWSKLLRSPEQESYYQLGSENSNSQINFCI